jgi:amidophosphoribosyltransferase
VIIVDDSIVRGTTSRQIVQMAREAGALRVVVVSSSPACTHPHIYGIDLADRADLIAYGRTWREIADSIGADEVIFLDLDGEHGLKAACLEAAERKTAVQDFEVGVFCGRYVTNVPDGYLERLSDLRAGRRPRQKPAFASVAPGGGEDVVDPPASSGPAGSPSGHADKVYSSRNGDDLDQREDVSLYNVANEPMDREK